MSRHKTALYVASCAAVTAISVALFIYVRNKKIRSENEKELKDLLNKEKRPQVEEEEELEEGEEDEDEEDGSSKEREGIGPAGKERTNSECCNSDRPQKNEDSFVCCNSEGGRESEDGRETGSRSNSGVEAEGESKGKELCCKSTDQGLEQHPTRGSCCRSSTDHKEYVPEAADTGAAEFHGNFIDDDVSHLYPAAELENPPAFKENGASEHSKEVRCKIIFVTVTGTSQILAEKLGKKLSARNVAVDVLDVGSYEPEDLARERSVIFIASTWSEGKAGENGSYLVRWLDESSEDFRVGSGLLQNCKFAVFGVGSSVYGENFNAVARALERHMTALGGQLMIARGEGDVDKGNVYESFEVWSEDLLDHLQGRRAGAKASITIPEELEEKNADALIQGEEEEEEETYYSESGEEEDKKSQDALVDLEDMAGALVSTEKMRDPKKKGFVRKGKKNSSGVVAKKDEKYFQVSNGDDRKEMVTPILRASLEKQGYKILGSHSGVKLCRWTKSQLRGRGGCYKHSFYGIESHRCMETTPSLACANKCVFCWRHHTNPVGKSWRWKMDDPVEIVDAALDQHTKMIKQMKGVPGVKPERLQEGMTPKHCALSLVGEPIMYPEINTLVDELHKRRISSFLVTNAQFPDRITQLRPVTQLYVSVDAATKEKLKAIDRPLFSDFWERFTDSLSALRDKRQRTVYRLTLVKGWNVAELDEYVALLQLGQPDFIEIKGVTYCGSTQTSSLTMENVPWHQDVKDFAEAVVAATEGEYELACEHVHSCCVLLAKVSKFKKEGGWYTWIDYEKFHDLVASGEPFGSEDYMAPTPSWAVYGSSEGGFDPKEVRVKKERRHGTSDPGGCT
ncbi:hypothetical protein R1sor_009325 [Riccia sorocarpa]|uniref:tRNA 4-demethylwyosine synthase (AdoMet-dependent) n=1 Tax=Riccia sorocarpa TaxID=122646 RepID=A0ABD3HY61_9MARC